jgi:putative hydrolase
MDAIDWRAAQRIGDLIAGSPPYGGLHPAAVEPLAHDFARRVSEYSGLELPAQLPPLEFVDRSAWIAANLKGMRPLLGRLTDRLADESSVLSGPLRAASGFLLGAQVGALTGMLSQRVLGQYDLALLDPAVPPRLLLLAPNLAQAARNLGVDRDELVLWVTIHEITHAVQFSGAPWLREHLGGMLGELIDGLQLAVGGRPSTSDAPDGKESDAPDGKNGDGPDATNGTAPMPRTGRAPLRGGPPGCPARPSCANCSSGPAAVSCCGWRWASSVGSWSSACRRPCP